jgi:hypothetical protein
MLKNAEKREVDEAFARLCIKRLSRDNEERYNSLFDAKIDHQTALRKVQS